MKKYLCSLENVFQKINCQCVRTLWFSFVLFILPKISLASSFEDSNDTVTEVIYNLCEWLSGPPAVAIGILAVIYSGYEMIHGEIDKNKFIMRCIGVGLIIGGSYIGKNIILNGITS